MKLNYKKINNFWMERAKIKDKRISTHFKHDDTHVFDLKLINNYTTSESEILDVACGTCYLANELVKKCKKIKAIDKYPEFLKSCNISNKLSTQASDILTYKDQQKYDIILMFGIISYFNEVDTAFIYSKYKKMLKPNGVLIVKHQCGIETDIIIDGYSEKIGQNYHAIYRSLEKDKSILKNCFNSVKVVDIYPSRLNPWNNSHFYAFIAND